ncbi:hypothetical protein RvY_18636 [Ramazzottius varieornatus]|uniref:U3 small nucleolar ribonucleoprotein protein MPP10 n=1 Tax=Ramazzottius varieornatus TaxID=947166 RepID=A0A1D1W6I2_RAMVA|nr:hypothetical protein RvY_18636 [Ramazzottius varieornatus]
MASLKDPVDLASVVQTYKALTSQPADFLSKDPSRATHFKSISKCIFDSVRKLSDVPHSSDLQELLTSSEFDDEQIWQQLELDNKLNVHSVVKKVADLLVNGTSDFFGVSSDNHSSNIAEGKISEDDEHNFGELHTDDEANELEDEDEDEDEGLFSGKPSQLDDNEMDEGEEEDEDVEEEEEVMNFQPRKNGPKSQLDDDFFKLSDMNDFLLESEKAEARNGMVSSGVDLFAADDEEDGDGEGQERYEDFFDPPEVGNDKTKGNSARFEEKSTFEKRQEKLKEKIQGLEEQAISSQPWQLGGEVSAVKRPENSLLEEFLQFEHVTRQAPVITEEVTLKLEDLIIQRIRNKAFDDVERKAKAKEIDPYEYKKKLVLEEAKSKQSLSQIYEQEYLKNVTKTNEEEEKEEHRKIRTAMNNLLVKLDALSNFHFVPKPVAPDIKIINNLPTIVVEDVQPSAVSTSQLLAPEEVQPKKKQELKGATEASETDKNRSRRKKKLRQKAMANHTKTKQTVALEGQQKVEKMKKKGGSSGAFFEKLQDTVRAEQTAKDDKLSKKRKTGTNNDNSVKKFKL